MLHQCRERSALLQVRVSPTAAPGHLLLSQAQWRYLGLEPRSHAKLIRNSDPTAPRMRPLEDLQTVKLTAVAGARFLRPRSMLRGQNPCP